MTINELDQRLMGEFTIESMMGEDAMTIPENVELSEDFNVRAMQEQAPLWCLRFKRFMLTPFVEPNTPQGLYATSMKQHMCKDFRNIKAMSYLYCSEDLDILIQQISMLAIHAQFKKSEDIFNIEPEIQRNALNPESVSIAIGLYTYFTMLENPHLNINAFNDLFIPAFCRYYENWMARVIMMRMNGNNWKSQFSGVLLD